MSTSDDLQELILILPGYELDGFPRSLPSEEADALLSGWLALWHPKLLATAKNIPCWKQANNPPGELPKSLIVVPEFAKSELSKDYSASPETTVIDAEPGWRNFQSKALSAAGLATDDGTSLNESVFAALGYAYLQIQLMTRQLRYTSNLDELLFSSQAVDAAEAALAGESEKAEDLLQNCFDTLGQERDHYYSLDVSLLDITLLAETTLGKSLRTQLEHQDTPTSYLASADLLGRLREKDADAFATLKSRLDEKDAIAGGLTLERPHPLMNRDALWRDLYRGKMAYEGLEVSPPTVFGRMSFGISTDNCADLRRFGFDGVLLTAWSNGTYPEGSQAKLAWESSDGTFISALATDVLDASAPESYLSLGWTVGDALDHQHVPTVLFAHWPNKTHEFLELVHIIAQRTPALGKWSNVKTYFDETDDPYHQERLAASGFKYNWLANAECPSSMLEDVKNFHTLSAKVRSLQNLFNIALQLESHRPKLTKPGADEESTTESPETPEYDSFYGDCGAEELKILMDGIDQVLDPQDRPQIDLEYASTLISKLTQQALSRIKKFVARNEPDSLPGGTSTELATGRLILNPKSSANRIRVQTNKDQEFTAESWNFCSGMAGHDRFTCVDVPPHGFVVAPFASQNDNSPKKQHLAEISGVVQNEFLEAQVDTARGHLKSLYIPGKRGNRLSVMLARRDREQDGSFSYSEMRATDVRMLTSSNICGLVRATGRLEKNNASIGNFEIDYETWRGSRILEVVVRLSNLAKLPDDNPWRSAYVLRVAWPSEAAILRSHNAGRTHPWPNGRVVSPNLIEIDEAEYKTHYLTGGLAFHRRTEERFLETVLATTPLRENYEHRVGFAVDLPNPQLAAEDFLDQRYSTLLYGRHNASSGWLASSDSKNVRVDLESCLSTPDGDTIGVRLFMTECLGKSTSTTVRLMHDVAIANRVDALGEVLGKLTTVDDGFKIALRANEQCCVDVIWK